MSFDYSLLSSLSARRLISALLRDGFRLDRQRGSHSQYIHPQKGRVTVSFHHPGDTFPPRTLRSMIEDAGWDEEDLRRLGLTK